MQLASAILVMIVYFVSFPWIDGRKVLTYQMRLYNAFDNIGIGRVRTVRSNTTYTYLGRRYRNSKPMSIPFSHLPHLTHSQLEHEHTSIRIKA